MILIFFLLTNLYNSMYTRVYKIKNTQTTHVFSKKKKFLKCARNIYDPSLMIE